MRFLWFRFGVCFISLLVCWLQGSRIFSQGCRCGLCFCCFASFWSGFYANVCVFWLGFGVAWVYGLGGFSFDPWCFGWHLAFLLFWVLGGVRRCALEPFNICIPFQGYLLDPLVGFLIKLLFQIIIIIINFFCRAKK